MFVSNVAPKVGIGAIIPTAEMANERSFRMLNRPVHLHLRQLGAPQEYMYCTHIEFTGPRKSSAVTVRACMAGFPHTCVVLVHARLTRCRDLEHVWKDQWAFIEQHIARPCGGTGFRQGPAWRRTSNICETRKGWSQYSLIIVCLEAVAWYSDGVHGCRT